MSEEGKRIDVVVTAERLLVYQLEEDVFFDVHQRVLKRKEDVEKLTPQQGVLLEAFLKADQYKLTRITSYNVCYTKLLRKGESQRITFFMRIEYDSYKFGVEYKSNQNNVPNT